MPVTRLEPGPPRVVFSAAFGGGTFYHAEALYRRGCLHRWLTTRPDALTRRVDRSKIFVNVWPEVLHRSFRKVPAVGKWYPADYLKATVFDAWARRKVDGADIVVAFADHALLTLRRAKAQGATTIVERGSAHILTQKELLTEEYERHGLGELRLDERLVAKQLQEYEEADYISVPSTFAWKSYVARGIPPERLLLVPMGVDLGYFRPVAKEDDVFRIVTVGGGVRKGLRYLVDAVAALKRPNLEVLILGGIAREEAPMLSRCAGLVKVLGKIPHREMYRYYSQGSVFISASIEDGWGHVVSEAMACGVPVICSTHTGVVDTVREGRDGFVVPVRDVEALREKISFLYEHEGDRRAMGREARGRAADFTWDAYGQRVTAEYRRILRARVASAAMDGTGSSRRSGEG